MLLMNLRENIILLDIKQLEMIFWSISKKGKEFFDFEVKEEKETLTLLINEVKKKSASMKTRSLAFAAEGLQNLKIEDDSVWNRLELVLLTKQEELNPHSTIKVLKAAYQSKKGSGKLYDMLIHKILKNEFLEELKYQDIITFFEIFPKVTHIF